MPARYLGRKLLRAALTLWLVVTVVFVALRLSGDPVAMLLPESTEPAVIELYRERWGLDRPLWAQYAAYLGSVLSGDLGRSFLDGRGALEVVLEKLPRTLELGLASFALALIVGIPAGIVAAWHRNTAIDRLVMAAAVLGHSLPTYFLGILLILLFAVRLRWLPSSGSGTGAHLVLPALTLGAWLAASLARFTRSAMLDVLNQLYMQAAAAKGLGAWRRLFTHAVPNAAIPVVTIMGLMVGHLIGGAVIIETVFAWPGVGRLTVTAVTARELSIVQAVVLLVAATMVTANMTVDLLYGWLDPRVRDRDHDSGG